MVNAKYIRWLHAEGEPCQDGFEVSDMMTCVESGPCASASAGDVCTDGDPFTNDESCQKDANGALTCGGGCALLLLNTLWSASRLNNTLTDITASSKISQLVHFLTFMLSETHKVSEDVAIKTVHGNRCEGHHPRLRSNSRQSLYLSMFVCEIYRSAFAMASTNCSAQ